MSEQEQAPKRSKLRIWQQNLNKSRDAQLDLLAQADAKEWDLILLQEPFLDSVGNTRAGPQWITLYPATHLIDGQPRDRVAMLVNKSIPSNTYRALPIFSADVMGIELLTNSGKLTLMNVYNSCTDNGAILTLSNYLQATNYSVNRADDDHMYWMGDFNRHHPTWEESRNEHLNSPDELITPLLELIATYDMVLALPQGIPTLQAFGTGNWTRPDNVWKLGTPVDIMISCDVKPNLRPIKTDHLPIITILDLSPTLKDETPKCSFRNVDWTKFHEKLAEKATLTQFVSHPTTPHELDTLLSQIIDVVTQTIEDTVPYVKPSPHMKRWWNPNLTFLRKEKNRRSRDSFYWRGDPSHPAHQAFAQASTLYATTMRKSKEDHWYQFLSSDRLSDLWTASRYISKPRTDGGKTCMPELKTGPEQRHIARSNEDKAAALAHTFFIPKPTNLAIPQVFDPPPELRPLTPYSKQRITNKASRLKWNKAPGPDGIPNEVWTECLDPLINPITALFNGVMQVGYYPKAWRESTTVVLRKPGRPAYDAPKAYRPIALLNTLRKLLSGLVADDISYLCEANNLISKRAYGGRPRRITTDAIHVLTHRIKDAWRNQRVASILFLDIQSAFPNLVPERLDYDMQMIGIPRTYRKIIASLLKDRTTHLHFDDYVSEGIPIDNGSDQGNPLSVVLYNIYHSGLTSIPSNSREDATGYIDDATLYAEGQSFEETNDILKGMMERPDGALNWSHTHASPFETSKLAVMHFAPSQSKKVARSPLVVRNEVTDSTFQVQEVNDYKYLGVILNRKLSWKPQHNLVLSRAVNWTNLFRRLVKTTRGLSFHSAKTIYNAVAVARINYACDVWYSPPIHPRRHLVTKGGTTITKKLSSVQRQATIAITGALRSTAADTLEVHAGIPPVQVRLTRLCTLAVARASTLTENHPLSRTVKRKATRLVKKHRTSFHNLLHGAAIDPQRMEKISPVRRAPNFTPIHRTKVENTRDSALAHDDATHNTGVRIYTDGSGHGGGIGAAAILYENGVPKAASRYYLGPYTEHTVFEAEIVGVRLGLKLASKSRLAQNSTREISISLDNTAVIAALNDQSPKPSHYLLDRLHDEMDRMDDDISERLVIKWVPGHSGSRGNEAADLEAKKAAGNDSSPAEALPRDLRKDLPISLSAIAQATTSTAKEMWTRHWQHSRRYVRSRTFAKKPHGNRYESLIKKLK